MFTCFYKNELFHTVSYIIVVNVLTKYLSCCKQKNTQCFNKYYIFTLSTRLILFLPVINLRKQFLTANSSVTLLDNKQTKSTILTHHPLKVYWCMDQIASNVKQYWYSIRNLSATSFKHPNPTIHARSWVSYARKLLRGWGRMLRLFYRREFICLKWAMNGKINNAYGATTPTGCCNDIH